MASKCLLPKKIKKNYEQHVFKVVFRPRALKAENTSAKSFIAFGTCALCQTQIKMRPAV